MTGPGRPRLGERRRGGRGAGHGRDAEAALSRIEELTLAERDVLRLLGTGLSNAEIAGQLYLSAGTVKAHISRTLTRTGCANRVQAAVLAHDVGLLNDR
ncbi:LuxR C-terminal-related transcriptional regulator [Streptomyces sp. 6N106]|uniref:LuxR C-terminal-related transcriptional regulator n=1 Tax=Streptomyces sp. 6N106 TaxID=3457418 RepID=UPI003FD31EEA